MFIIDNLDFSSKVLRQGISRSQREYGAARTLAGDVHEEFPFKRKLSMHIHALSDFLYQLPIPPDRGLGDAGTLRLLCG